MRSIVSPHKKVMPIMLLLVAQFFSVFVEAFQTVDDPASSNGAHHELQLTQYSGDSLSNNVALQTDSDDEKSPCDHCCACHGHCAHMGLPIQTINGPLQRFSVTLPKYITQFNSYLNHGIYRPPIILS